MVQQNNDRSEILDMVAGTVQTKSLKDIIKEEYARCASDPAYFIKKYCIIQHPIKGKIPFRLWDFQEKTLNQFRNERLNIILKARQLGISSLVAGYSLWLILFHGDKNILVIATKKDVAKNLVTKVRVMHDYLPSWLKGKTTEDNKLSLVFSNGSQIKAEASSESSGRSESLSLLVLDEAAFIEEIEKIWASSALTLATGGDCIILSTPNGIGNLFHKIWQSAEEGATFGEKFNFKPVRLHWSVHPEHDIEWRRQQTILLGERLAAQECDCDFITSGMTVIEGPIIQWYKESMVKDPVEKRYIDHNYWVWKYPESNKTYVVAADPARGDGEDSSAFQVLDVESLEQVAEYKGQVGTKEFGNLLVAVATEYNDALLVVENQSMGWAVLQQIIDRNYKNLFYSSADMMVVDVQSQLKRQYDMRSTDNTDKLVAGITSGPKIRPLVVSKIDEYFRSKDIKVFSNRLVNELFTFIWKNGRPDHLAGYHDDAIFALGYALLVRDTALKLKQAGIELQRMALDRIKTTAVYTPESIRIVDPYKLPIKQGYTEDMRWLFDVTTEESIALKKKREVEEERNVGTPAPPSIG